MSKDTEAIGERDLMAYADGFLDADPARKAAVERHLERDAGAHGHVAEIAAQNEEIRAFYGRALAEPVPARLQAALSGMPAARSRATLRAASVAALTVIAAGGGWIFGQSDGGVGNWTPDRFVTSAALHHGEAEARNAMATGAGIAPMGKPLAWLNQKISLEIAAPDLSVEGFTLVDKEKIGTDSDPTVRLVYRAADDTTLNLFLRPRWEERGDHIARTQANGVTVHYWLDGPLAFALTTDAAGEDADRLAAAVHRSVKRTRLMEQPPATALDSAGSRAMPMTVGSDGLAPLPAGTVAADAPDRQLN